MDEQLAAIYGTGQVEYEEGDLEKTAAAELLVKLAEEEGVDLNQFSDEDVAGMINELYGSEIEHTAEADEGQEKFAEADFLGRVMAHSMVQELGEIEKEAASWGQKAKAMLARAGEATGAGDIVSGLRGKMQARGLKREGAKIFKDMPSSGKAQELFRQSKHLGEGASEALREGGKRFGKRVGLPAAAVAGAGGAYALGKSKSKKASAIDKLAEMRAYEMLAEAGYELDDGQEKTALDHQVEVQALQMLEAAGYPVEWNE